MFPFRQVFAAAVCLLGVGLSHGATAQTPAADPPVRLTLAQASSFAASLKALAAQGKVCIVAEGTPRAPTLPSKEAALLTPPGTLSAVAMKLAEAYDYEMARDGSVVLFRKRYTDARELPSVTLEECAAALGDIQNVFKPFNPNLKAENYPQRSLKNPLVLDLARTLSDEQTAALRASKLRVASLSPDQAALVRRFALFMYAQGPADDVVLMLGHIQNFQKAVVCMGRLPAGLKIGGQENVPGWEFVGSGNVPILIALAWTLNGSGWGGNLSAATVWSAPPAEKGKAENKTAEENKTPAETLDTVGKRLAVRDDTLHVTKILADKTIAVAGEENAAPLAVLKGMATVYGLRVKNETDGTHWLARPAVRIPLEISAISLSLRAAVPEPLMRAGRRRDMDAMNERRRKLEQEKPDGKDPKKAYDWWGRWIKLEHDLAPLEFKSWQGMTTRRDEAQQRFRKLLEARLRADPAARIPTGKLTAEERGLFGLVVLTNAVDGLRATVQQPPVYILRFDSLVLSGGYGKDDKGNPTYTLGMRAVNPDGSDGGGTSIHFHNLNN